MVDRWAPWVGIVASLVFTAGVWYRGTSIASSPEQSTEVIVPALVQIVLYGGDRFLAANVESVRASASGHSLEGREGGYRIRAHRVVAQLNPCHEDNYWIGNAALSFGGAPDTGSELLGRATQCRFWDELPPFLYGFNQKFFRFDAIKARKAIELAADRATTNAAGFRQIAIMMTINTIKDAHAALGILRYERDRARDAKLRAMLDQRIERMLGLVTLREAQKAYEVRFGKRLVDPSQLLQTGLLAEIPQDPLRLGYEFRDGEFYLQQLKVDGFN